MEVEVARQSSGKPKVIRAPHNPTAKKAYYEAYGKMLAEAKVEEVKNARFGVISAYDRLSDFVQLPGREGYKNTNRKETYKKALQLYGENELVRPIINLIASSIFAPSITNTSGIDVRGKNKRLVELARKIIDNNSINFHDFGREGELAGDVFLWFEPDGDRTKIYSLDAGSTESELENDNVREVALYVVSRGTQQELKIAPDRVQQLKFNSTSTSQYGRSSLRHLIYQIDVIDSLFEKNWLRGAQYFGNPQLVITGVPGPYQANVKSQLEAQTQRTGRSIILPPESDAKPIDYTLGFPIGDIVGWVFRLISIGSEIPITLLGTADAASRGSAFFANPRCRMAITPKREVWRLGLRNFFLKIFQTLGEIPEGEVLSSKDFDFGFFPIMPQDLDDLADLIEIYRDRQLVSKKSSRELVGLDHSDEEEYMEDEEPEVMLVQPGQNPAGGQVPQPQQRPQAQPREQRRASVKKRKRNVED